MNHTEIARLLFEFKNTYFYYDLVEQFDGDTDNFEAEAIEMLLLTVNDPECRTDEIAWLNSIISFAYSADEIENAVQLIKLLEAA